MKRMPLDRHVPRKFSSHSGARTRAVRRAMLLAGTAAMCAAVLPSGIASATPGRAASGHSGLAATLAEANSLSSQIDRLSEQYDGLKIQYKQAKSEEAIAMANAARDQKLLTEAQGSLGTIAVETYMTGGVNPTLELLTSSSPQGLLNRASIMTQIQRENGAKVDLVAAAEDAAQRAQAAASQQAQSAARLQSQMAAKVAVIQQKESFFNSQAFKLAAAVYQRTGHYPNIKVTGDSVGVQALRWALTRIGDPYVWGAAGPSAFDCSGLVVWAYGKIGISLMHYTGDLWNEGEHISRSELEPGDLVFFFPDIGHVGIYVGNGLMVDAPTYGQPVQVQPVFWSAYVGAVRIVA